MDLETLRKAAWSLGFTLQPDSPTGAELAPFIGHKWAICRDTPAMRARYGADARLLTMRQFKEAERKAIAARRS